MKDWKTEKSEVLREIERQASKALASYVDHDELVEEHVGQERDARDGGYGRRQLFELLQNGADQLTRKDGRLHVVLTEDAMYCANAGDPFSAKGVTSILHAYLSRKDDEQIGRFGLGFKSVLGVTTTPTVLSRSGSFRFGPDVASRIREVAPEANDLPLLRIAAPCDAHQMFKEDPIAADLAAWASTIVILPFAEAGVGPWLSPDMKTFPSAFLAFAENVDQLVLDDRTADLRREISAERKKSEVVIQEGSQSETWVVFSEDVPLGEKARKRAGKLGDHKSVGVKWAVPLRGSKDLGSFWAYFPTDDETTLRGVLNAPWQLSADRRRLAAGPYNEELLKGAVDLVVSSLEELRSHDEDPTRYLELLPGRGKEPRCWADGVITDETNDALRFRESIPLLAGDLEIPARARLHPPDLPETALHLWAREAEAGEWVHHSIERQKDRRARVERYIEPRGPESIEDWFGELLAEPSPQRGVTLARLAGVLQHVDGAEEICRLPFVLTDALELVSPDHPGLMLPGEHAVENAGITFVHQDVAHDEVAALALRAYGIEQISLEVELRRLIEDAKPGSDSEWVYFWEVTRQLSVEDASAVIKAASDFEPRVKTLAGDFKRIIATLLPGRCVPSDGSRDAHAAIDERWHQDDMQLLQLLGCTDGPRANSNVQLEPWFSEYVEEAIELFEELNRPARPSRDAMKLMPGSKAPGPLAVLRGLSDEGKAALVQVALESANGLDPWTVVHSNTKYREARVPNPAVWLIREEGLLRTPVGPRRAIECVGPELRVGGLTPAPSCSSAVARALNLPETWSDVRDPVLEDILVGVNDADPAQATRLYVSLVGDHSVVPPEYLRCWRHGTPEMAAREEVAVSSDESVTELLAGGSACVIEVQGEDAKALLIDRWDLVDAGSLISRRIAVAALSDPILLIDEFRPLKRRLAPTDYDLELQRCEEIRVIEEIVGGTRSTDVEFARDGSRFYCSAGMSPQQLLRAISGDLALGLDGDDIERVIRGVEDQRVKKLVRAVRSADSDSARLARLLGADALRAGLPRSVLDAYIAIHGEPNELQLAELASSVHGVDVLKVHQVDLEEHGLTPPGRWGGGRPAKEFVRSLGFPVELAGFETSKRPAELLVDGRPKMPPLHGYQKRIAAELYGLLGRDRQNRGMLTLPTGAGKTRVAIEGVIKALSDDVLGTPLVLWVAQSDELCEQAVQAWSELWRASQLEERLTISRLWSDNEADLAAAGVQVVVATIHKLQRVVDNDDYEWLSTPGALVIDEAHGSIAPMYTKLLEWLGLERGKFGPPLVGLTATPYRGRSEEQTKRLAQRYGNERLDLRALGEGDHYPRLQAEGVISRVTHEILPGSDVRLRDDELKRLDDTGLLPKAADTRLGEDVDRTRRVLESINRLPQDWPVLVFAPSIENAQALAGLLNHEGISAAAIWGETPDQARRWYVREFRENRIRVITNYAVLAEGFDAPSVRAVYIARPVFTPNRYQQMVGRGLRGPLNGGKEECLIVDVEDNIVNFERQLAFRDFEYLWDETFAEAAVR